MSSDTVTTGQSTKHMGRNMIVVKAHVWIALYNEGAHLANTFAMASCTAHRVTFVL